MTNKSPITEALDAFKPDYPPSMTYKEALHKWSKAHARLAKFAPLIEAVIYSSVRLKRLQGDPYYSVADELCNEADEQKDAVQALLDAGWPIEEGE